MTRIIYDGKECEVISVQTEWEWAHYNGDKVRKPGDTWLLINYDGYLIWVYMSDCKGV